MRTHSILLFAGGYGKVYRGVLNKADVAIKVVSSHDPGQQAKFVQEIVTLRACHNTNIVQVPLIGPADSGFLTCFCPDTLPC